MTVLHTAK